MEKTKNEDQHAGSGGRLKAELDTVERGGLRRRTCLGSVGIQVRRVSRMVCFSYNSYHASISFLDLPLLS